MTTHTHGELNKDPAKDEDSLELPIELQRRIMELAEREGRDPNDVVRDALLAYEKSEADEWLDELHKDERYLAAVEEGIRSANEEPLVGFDEVKAHARAKLAALLEQRKAP